jgi:ankyrin repeat protein
MLVWKAISPILLRSGANTQARADDDDFTPLHIAIKSGSSELVQLLLAHDCEMKEKQMWAKQRYTLQRKRGTKSL